MNDNGEVAFRLFNDRLRSALRPVHCLQTIRWPDEVGDQFLKRKGRDEPRLSASSYPNLGYNAAQTSNDLIKIQHDALRTWGRSGAAGRFLERRCDQAVQLVEMLQHRGRRRFGTLGRSAFEWNYTAEHVDAISSRLAAFEQSLPESRADAPRFEAFTAASLLAVRLAQSMAPVVGVAVDADIAANAVASRAGIRLRDGGEFSLRDLDLLEVHEAWIHFLSTENAKRQPIMTVLSRGNPQVWRTQEGLAVLAELVAGVSSRERIRQLRYRFYAVHLADQGADFRTIFRLFLDEGGTPRDAYRRAVRIVRGAFPAPGAFFKDACYAAGLFEVAEFINGGGDPAALTDGKVSCQEVADLNELAEMGWLTRSNATPGPLRDEVQVRTWARLIAGNRNDSTPRQISNFEYHESMNQCQPASK